MDQNKNTNNPQPITPKPKMTWEEIVAKANGQLMFVPEVLISSVQEWQKKKKEFEDALAVIGKQELTVSNLFQNLMFEIRKYAESAGHPDIWVKDIGFESNALKDGKFIINITDGK